MAAPTRRNDHIYLTEITKRLRGPKRTTIETLNRLVVLAVAGFMVWFGLKNAMLDLGSFSMPWLILMTVYTGIVPIAGVIIMLFSVELILHGVVGGYDMP